MRKKILAFLCAAAMLLTMTACGSSAPAETTQTTAAATQPETVPETEMQRQDPETERKLLAGFSGVYEGNFPGYNRSG